VSFQTASTRIGSMVVNWLRLVIALVFLTLLGLVLHGQVLPDAPASAWGWLALSGLIGFVLGDLALFRAFVLIGARLSMLVMCLAPPLTAMFGWLFLGEQLTPTQVAGMALTVAGVAWTVLERDANARRPVPVPTAVVVPRTRLSGRFVGVLLAGVGALGQAGGLIFSKLGMAGLPDPFAATQVRVLAGIAGFSVLFFATRWWSRVGAARRDARALGFTTLGSFFGPFLGVSLSLLAVHRTQAGVAAALMSIVPVLMIPVAFVAFRERVSLRSAAGTVLAVAGVIVLFR
jgi:uncharacterized membrane protein